MDKIVDFNVKYPVSPVSNDIDKRGSDECHDFAKVQFFKPHSFS